jgi:hypothetical protein
MIFCSGIVIIILGLLSIFAQDLVWDFTEWQNRSKGVVSERTPEWETATTIGGMIAIVCGIVLIMLGFSTS